MSFLFTRPGNKKQSGEFDADSLRQELQRITEVNNALNKELISVRKERDEMKALANQRAKELLDAQKLWIQRDSISVSDLKEKVVALNDEIFQAAASLGEAMSRQAHNLTKEDTDRMYDDIVQLAGEPISLLVAEEGQKLDTEANPLLAQVVFQVLIAKFCVSKIELWIPNYPRISDFFTAVYTNIQGAEQAVSGRWRALTHTHARPVTRMWKEDLISNLMRFIKIAAWKTPDKKQRLSFEDKLVPLFKAVEDLRIAIGEKITSADFQLSLVPPDSQFIVDCMDDALADGRVKTIAGGPIQRVIGTTGIGLQKVITGQQEPLYDNYLSPKVLVETTLRDALKQTEGFLRSVMCGKD